MQPINTFYNGNYYRSRLEARWAVFFDESGIKYQYESEGFKLDNGNCYLPDFYLPDIDTYMEVKPSYQSDKGNPEWTSSSLWISKHEDYNAKWIPFSNTKKLGFLIGMPGEMDILVLTRTNPLNEPESMIWFDSLHISLIALIRSSPKNEGAKAKGYGADVGQSLWLDAINKSLHYRF